MRKHTTALVCVVLGATLSTARADDTELGPAAPTAAAAASSGGTPQLTLPKGRVVLDVYVPINLSDTQAFKPVSISPDLWYGVDDKLTVGLVHSSGGASGFIGTPKTALCLTGTDNGCDKVYNNVGLDARYQLKPGTTELTWALDG